ncbi:hypothetical protein VTO73DRAFT_7017 [Trametes versicolor]
MRPCYEFVEQVAAAEKGKTVCKHRVREPWRVRMLALRTEYVVLICRWCTDMQIIMIYTSGVSISQATYPHLFAAWAAHRKLMLPAEPARRIPGHAMYTPKTIMSMTTSASFVPQDIPSPPRRDYHVASAIRRAYRAVVTFSAIRGTYDSYDAQLATSQQQRHRRMTPSTKEGTRRERLGQTGWGRDSITMQMHDSGSESYIMVRGARWAPGAHETGTTGRLCTSRALYVLSVPADDSCAARIHALWYVPTARRVRGSVDRAGAVSSYSTARIPAPRRETPTPKPALRASLQRGSAREVHSRACAR